MTLSIIMRLDIDDCRSLYPADISDLTSLMSDFNSLMSDRILSRFLPTARSPLMVAVQKTEAPTRVTPARTVDGSSIEILRAKRNHYKTESSIRSELIPYVSMFSLGSSKLTV